MVIIYVESIYNGKVSFIDAYNEQDEADVVTVKEFTKKYGHIPYEGMYLASEGDKWIHTTGAEEAKAKEFYRVKFPKHSHLFLEDYDKS